MNDLIPHLVGLKLPDDTRTVYMLKPGVNSADLTEIEVDLLNISVKYLKEKQYKAAVSKLMEAQDDFARLLEIDGMPEEASKILEKWKTT